MSDSPHISILVGESPIDGGGEWAAMHAQTAIKAGAVACFSGAVRGGEVQAMTLEHYPGMTEKALTDIAAAAAQKWPLLAARIVHRVGRMQPGEVIVFVAAAAAHRADAFAACAYMMDYLKTRAPFWKKEETLQGERWVESRPADEQSRAAWDKS